jgi:hypothetical protein
MKFSCFKEIRIGIRWIACGAMEGVLQKIENRRSLLERIVDYRTLRPHGIRVISNYALGLATWQSSPHLRDLSGFRTLVASGD